MNKVTIDDVEGLREFVIQVRETGKLMETTANSLQNLILATFKQAAQTLVRAADQLLVQD